MKIPERYIIVGAVALFITLVVGFGLVLAGGPAKFQNGDFEPGVHGRGFHHRFMGKMIKERILARMDGHMEELNLSETQRLKYEEVRSNIITRMSEGMEARREFFESLRTEINGENPDLHVMADQIKEKIRGMSGFIEENLDLFLEFHDTLDEDQKAKVLEHFREKMNRRGGCTS